MDPMQISRSGLDIEWRSALLSIYQSIFIISYHRTPDSLSSFSLLFYRMTSFGNINILRHYLQLILSLLFSLLFFNRMTLCGTAEYMAPELMFDEDSYSFEIDVFSFGMVLLEVLKRGRVGHGGFAERSPKLM